MTEPITDPTTEPTTDPTIEPVTDPTIDHMAGSVCPSGTAFADAVEAIRRGAVDEWQAANELTDQLLDEELLWLLDGDLPLRTGLPAMARRYNAVPYEAGRLDRLGIPGIRFTDGTRGVAVGSSTAFPVAIARAASWDPDLERRIGDAIGAEARAQGANLFAGICVNLAYPPGWGRAQESHGEDPLLLGAMGAALCEGVRPWVLACVKHFALNSMEEARFSVDVSVDDDVLHEVFLPHFRTVVEAGVDAVMSAYNSVNGTWAGEHPELLTGILRDRWGFEGFVMTDFVFGLHDPVGSVAAGQDLEMPLRQQRAHALPAALTDGRLARADAKRSAVRLVRAQLALARRARPTPADDVVACAEHRALAREAARRSCVLVRNEAVGDGPALPLDARGIESLVVTGPLADQPNQGDVGSSQVHPPEISTIVDGLRARLGDRLVHVADVDDPDQVASAAGEADAAVVVVGLSSRDEGESLLGIDTDSTRALGGIARRRLVAGALRRVIALGAERNGWGGDRRDLGLHADDIELVRAVAAANPRTIVVVIGGGTVVLDPWHVDVAAILLAWYPGMEGGVAVADLLLGDAEPSGRLPVTIPRRGDDLPVVDWNADAVTYGRWWGQRRLDRNGVAAAYPLGFGLGYTTFELSDLRLGPVDGERFTATVTVTNTGARAGRHVVQLYAVEPCDTGRPVRSLVGFRSVEVHAGEAIDVEVDASVRPLQRWVDDGFVLDPRVVAVEAGACSGDPRALTGELDLGA